jgi:hypothetical protein
VRGSSSRSSCEGSSRSQCQLPHQLPHRPASSRRLPARPLLAARVPPARSPADRARRAHEEHLYGHLRERRIRVGTSTDHIYNVGASPYEKPGQVHREGPPHPRWLCTPSFPQLDPHQANPDGPPQSRGRDLRKNSRAAATVSGRRLPTPRPAA